MGIDYDADLGYGVKLPKSLKEEDFDREDFKIIYGGNAYSDETMHTFLCVKETVISVSAYSDLKKPIDPKHFVLKPYWEQKLLDWCKKYNVADPKVGWWICASVC